MKAYTIGLYEKAMPKELNWKEKLEAAKAVLMRQRKSWRGWTGVRRNGWSL